jgi:hypothetical protein
MCPIAPVTLRFSFLSLVSLGQANAPGGVRRDLGGEAGPDAADLLGGTREEGVEPFSGFALPLGRGLGGRLDVAQHPIDGSRDPSNTQVPRAAFYYCLGAHFAVVCAMTIFGFGGGRRDPNSLQLGVLAAVAAAGPAARGYRNRALHLVIWAVLLLIMLVDRVPAIASPT